MADAIASQMADGRWLYATVEETSPAAFLFFTDAPGPHQGSKIQLGAVAAFARVVSAVVVFALSAPGGKPPNDANFRQPL
jgi:hypothetical protein